MSYILDALRRAESERVKDQTPSLHDMTLAPAEVDEFDAPRKRMPIALAVFGGSALMLGAAAAWWLMREPVAPPATAPVFAPAERPPVASATLEAPQAPNAPTVIAPAPVQPPVQAPPLAQAEMPPRVILAPPVAPPQRPATVRQVPAATPKPASTEAIDERAVPTLNQLPAELRNALPPMRFEGTVYSDNAADRMLMVNGQLLHEGEKVGGEVLVERIKPRSAVMQFRGQRFEFFKQ